ncbi:MAG: prepilin-type N-terminal cleavage/methylation domain-containing protein [Candidatus Omnitrophica bacterium]|nr:prepilin-type N-terminal cleavage/methylation domain-containing protein [Candidatus Omnitrophota bacterium]
MHIPKKGFTLIEVLIAIFILGVGMLGIFSLFPMAWQNLNYSRKLNEVAFFANKKFDEIKSQGVSLPMGNTAGQEGDLNWAVTVKTLPFENAIEVVFVQLEVDFIYKNKAQRQRFITFL